MKLKLNQKSRSLTALMACGVLGTAVAVSASPLYEETFATPPGPNGVLSTFGWAPAGPQTFNGTFNFPITNSVTLQPMSPASPLFIGNGTAGSVMAFYTTDSAANTTFSDISFTGNLVFGVFNSLHNGTSANLTQYFLVQDGGSWYASATPIAGPTSSNGFLYDPQSLTLSPTAANWVTVSGIPGTANLVYGSTPGSDLGSTITGAGIIFTLNNSSFQSFDWADFTISPVPEPTTLALLGAGGALLVLRARKK